MLLTLNDEDFENLNVTNIIHKKKIMVEINRICPPESRQDVEDIDDLYIKRERMRNLKIKAYAVSIIQRVYRRFAGKLFIARLKLEVNLNYKSILLEKKILESEGWWTEKKIPSKKIKNLLLNEVNKKEAMKREIEDFLMEEKREKEKKAARNAQRAKKILLEAQKKPKNTKKNEAPKSEIMIESYTVESENRKNKLNLTDTEIDDLNDEKEMLNARFDLFSLKLRSQNDAMDLIGSSGVKNNNIIDKNRSNDGDNGINDNPNLCVDNNNHNSNDNNNLILPLVSLPHIKTFGKKCDRLTLNGWGMYNDLGAWLPLIKERELLTVLSNTKSTETTEESSNENKNANEYDVKNSMNIRKNDTNKLKENPNGNYFHEINKLNNIKRLNNNKNYGADHACNDDSDGNIKSENMDVNSIDMNIDINLINASNNYEYGKSLDNVKFFNVINDLTHNPTILFSEKLRDSGYDKRRMDNFLKNRM